jgi:iron(III) transport system substrate-binding protein
MRRLIPGAQQIRIPGPVTRLMPGRNLQRRPKLRVLLRLLRRVSLLIPLLLLAAAPASAFEIVDPARLGPDTATRVLRVISTGDVALFQPVLDDFLTTRPGIAIDYTVASSSELARAFFEGKGAFDVAISSAMDLQTKLVNDGHARAHRSARTAALPDHARWRDHLFAFTEEPAAVLVSRAALEGLATPRTRQDLIALMRSNPQRFGGRVGTYDIRTSGLGYLFATQDARTSETFWRLAEVMGALGVRLYCCSGQMIDDVASGELALAYNVLGSYARAHPQRDRFVILLPEDFTTVMARTAFIPADSAQPALAGAFVDHLLITSDAGLWPTESQTAARPIRIGPGLLVFLDRFKRAAFIEEWASAMLQSP